MRRNTGSASNPNSRRTVRHAAFQPDSRNLYQENKAEWASANQTNDSNWQVFPAQTEDQQDDPWQTTFSPSPKDWIFEEDQALNSVMERGVQHPQAQPLMEDRKSVSKLSVLVLLVSLAAIIISALSIYRAYQKQPAFLARLNAMKGQAFFDGIHIDGVPVGGMTPSQIRQQSSFAGAAADPQLDIRLVIDGMTYQFNSSHVPFERNLEEVMEEAWSIGRQGSLSMIGSPWTPFEIRWQHISHTKRAGAWFTTEVTYSSGIVDALAQSVVQQINRDPVNAVVAAFNFSTREFTVTQDVAGRRLEAEAIANALKQALNTKEYQAVIQLQSATILPKVTSFDLKNNFTMLANFSTKTTSDEDRNNNIALAAQAISNRTLMPGEVFSFNEATGQRTIQKGYRGAPAILGGVLIDDVGGGVCQVSSTLFYAAAKAGMTIVERSPHAWPVSYMDKGLDATVNWPNLDFKFRNDQDTPVFIISYYSKRTLNVEFHGMINEPGETIQLETLLVSSQQPPSEPLMQQNPALLPNTQHELKQARTGYVVDTFRVYLRNGSEYRREKLFTSRYSMVQQVIEYN